MNKFQNLLFKAKYVNGINDTKLYGEKIIRKSQISIWDNLGKSLRIKWNKMLILILKLILHFMKYFGISQFKD